MFQHLALVPRVERATELAGQPKHLLGRSGAAAGIRVVERRPVWSDRVNPKQTGIGETRTASNGTVSHIWKAEGQPPVKKEESLPAWHTFNPTVFISSSNWKTYGNEVRNHLLAATEDQPETEQLARQLTLKVPSPGSWMKWKILVFGPDLVRGTIPSIAPPFGQ